MSRQPQIEIDSQTEAKKRDTTLAWGERLRETRIRRGMSVEEVASALLLEASLIEAIEAEQCDQLPGSSFVKGYMRNYAKLLEVDAEPLIEAYSRVCGNDEPELTQVARIKEVTSKDAAPRYTTWIVGTILVVSFGIWWGAKMLSPKVVDKQKPVTAVAPEAEAPTQPVSPFLQEQPATEPASKKEQPPADLTAAGKEQNTPAAPTPAEPAQDTIRLTLSADSWIEIEDGSGKKVYMDLARAGQTKVVQGQPPFKVLLGNAPAVTVEYNGEVYDHSTSNRKGVARFTLGE
jgi:cytoskeleton protein RodZ